MSGAQGVICVATLLLTLSGCRITGVEETPVPVTIHTAFVSYMARRAEPPATGWAGIDVTIAISNVGPATVELMQETLELDLDGVWTSVSSVATASGGTGIPGRQGESDGPKILPGERRQFTAMYVPTNVPDWRAALLRVSPAGRYRVHVFVRSNATTAAEGPMSYTEPFVVVEE